MKSGGWPDAASLAASAFDASTWMSTKATLAFCSTKASTVAAPIPVPPPVTKTTLSSRDGYRA